MSRECVCVCVDLQVEEHVEVRDDDVPVLHLAPHVLDGVDGGLVVSLRAASWGKPLQPHTACLTQLIKDQASKFHCLDLCTHTHHTLITPHMCAKVFYLQRNAVKVIKPRKRKLSGMK